MIRDAKEEDLQILTEYCGKFWGTTDYEEEADLDHIYGMVKHVHEEGILAVAEEQGKAVGFIACLVGPLMGNPIAKFSVELAWWMEPDYRGVGRAISLLEYAEDRARGKGVKYFSMLSMQSSMPERVNSLYESLGYVHNETTYTKVLTWQQ